MPQYTSSSRSSTVEPAEGEAREYQARCYRDLLDDGCRPLFPLSLLQYLPESESGVILYTTRSPDVASRATDEVELHKMSEQEATTMLGGL
jgi:hypothetical protein